MIRRVGRRATSVRLAALFFVVGGFSWPGSVEGQTPGDLTSRCVAAGGDLGACRDGEIAARAVAAQAGLLTGWGSEIAGSASTLGRKLGSTPRMAFSLRAGGMSMGMPDLFDEGSGPAPDVAFLVPALQGGVALGILDGFSPMATVGGVLSLDLFGSVSVVMPPSSQGFEGSATGGSVGVRVGVLRESFTLPGVSVSLSRRFVGGLGLGDTGIGDRTALDVSPSVNALRVTVGKDLFGVGVLAGWGRDDVDADAELSVADAGGNVARTSGATESARNVYFGGVAMNFLLLQLSLEGGWAGGLADLPLAGGGRFDPTAGSAFGSLSARFTP